MWQVVAFLCEMPEVDKDLSMVRVRRDRHNSIEIPSRSVNSAPNVFPCSWVAEKTTPIDLQGRGAALVFMLLLFKLSPLGVK